MLKVPFLIDKAVISNRLIALQTNQMTILITLANNLPTYASNSVHHMPMETAPPPESTTLLNSLLPSSVSTTSNSQSINITSGSYIIHSSGSYTVNMPMSPTSVCKPYPVWLDHLLMEEQMVVWPALMSGCSDILSDMQILWE